MATQRQVASAARPPKRSAGSALNILHVPYEKPEEDGEAPLPEGTRGEAIARLRDLGNQVLAGVTVADHDAQEKARRKRAGK